MKRIFLITILLFSSLLSSQAMATHCELTSTCQATSLSESTQSRDRLNEHITIEFRAHRIWIISIFWEDNILPALMLMAEQLSAVAVKQTEAVGMFFDAKHQLETQQTLQKITARAHKTYHPSEGMCEIGSSIKSLAASDRLTEVNRTIMAQRSVDRALGNANTSGATVATDNYSRLKQFREVYCNRADHNAGLDYMCDHDQDNNPASGGTGAATQVRMNRDVDFFRTVGMPWTLAVNFTNGGAATPDEEDVLALGTNLFGNEIFPRRGVMDLLPENVVTDPNNKRLTSLQEAYMDSRSVMAKRSVAENSFNALVGMKSEGTAGSRDFLDTILEELGVEDTDTDVQTTRGDITDLRAMLGENPSYYAQMEVLTKKIYQNPDFYTNLYDKPANVQRKAVALQAIALMQKFDMLKSQLRNEASQSILLELAVEDLQTEYENLFGQLNTGGQ